MIFNVFSNKKRQAEYEKKLEELKVGDKVVTNAGIYGEIVSIRHTNFGKVALLKSGEDDRVSYISVNLSVILGIDEKHDVIVDSEGNIIDPEAEKEESKAEEVVVEPTVEVKEEKTEVKKTPAKKTSTTAKKTTTKKTKHFERIMNVGVISLGCDKNTVDAEKMMYLLSSYGFKFVSDVEKANIAIINTNALS